MTYFTKFVKYFILKYNLSQNAKQMLEITEFKETVISGKNIV